MQEKELTNSEYAEQLAVQMRKGFLAYCVLLICASEPVYSSDIIERLRSTHLVVVEGTMYPLLSRLQKDGLLEHEWKESEQGPPRKYYRATSRGAEVAQHLGSATEGLSATLSSLKKGIK